MKKFKFIGFNGSDYGWVENPKRGQEYTVEQLNKMAGDDVPEILEENIICHPEEWQEVPEPTKPLHKDTNLGYFAGLMLQSIIPICQDIPDHKLVVFSAIQTAKELITQLDKEVGNG